MSPLVFVCFLFSATANYHIILANGVQYECRGKYVIDQGLVRFTLMSGAEMGVPKTDVAWYETFVANGEQPPSWAQPLRRKTPKPALKLPRLDFRVDRIRMDLNRYRQDGVTWEGLKQTSILTFLAILGATLVLNVLLSLLLWRMLAGFGEFHPWWKLTLWHMVLLLLLGAVLVGSQFSPFEPVSTGVSVFLLTFVLWAGTLNKVLDVELNNALLTVLFYQCALALLGWVVISVVGFTGLLDILLGA